jgi:exportin-T
LENTLFNVAQIIPEEAGQYMQSIIVDVLDQVQRKSSVHWTRVELGLYLMYNISETFGGGSQLQYVIKEGDEQVGLTFLGELIGKLVNSGISAYPHPSVSCIYFDCIVRYYAFFESRKELIVVVLAEFLDKQGVYHGDKRVRERVWYVFYRFVKSLRPFMGNYAQAIVTSLKV